MTVLDPPRTLTTVAGLVFLSGVLWAGIAALVIYLASTYLPPRIPHGQVWAEWRRRRTAWFLAIALGAAASHSCAELIARSVGLRDIYWLTRAAEIYRIAWLGGACGYLFGLLLCVVVSLLLRRRHSRPAGRP